MSTPRETLCSNVLNLNTPPVLSGIVTENTPLFKRRSRGAIFGHNFFSEVYIALDSFSASLEKQVGWWNWLILLRSHCRNIILSNFRSDKTNSQIIEVSSQDLKENDKNNKTTASKAEALLLYYHLAKAFSCQVKYLEKKVKTWNRSKVEDKNNSSPRPIMAQNAKNIKNVSFAVKPLCELFHDLYEDD